MTPLSIFNFITFSNSFFAYNIMRKVASLLYTLLFGLRFSKHHATTFAFMGQIVDHSMHGRTLCVCLTFSKQRTPCSESKNVGGNRKCNLFGSYIDLSSIMYQLFFHECGCSLDMILMAMNSMVFSHASKQ